MFNNLVSAWEQAFEATCRAQQAGWTAATRYLELLTNSYARLWGKHTTAVVPRDSRFADEAWRENPAYDAIWQSYVITAQWLMDITGGLQTLSPETDKRIRFWTQQAVDALSPANFALTNPVVLQQTLRTGGMNLARGMQNLLADLQRGQLRMVPDGSFQPGKDLACTPGKVVYRNQLIELIQYAPTTKRVRSVPFLVIPPWINRYYVMDLRPENSMFRYLVDAGFTLFSISWKNPSAGHPALDMDFVDYMQNGPLAALNVALAITGAEKANLVGYCAGGILLQATLAYLAARNEDGAASSATFFATHHDFSEAGDIEVFLSEQDLQFLEWLMKASGGYLDGRNLAATFNLLRANDLLWHFVVHNYLLGEDPPAFDMLYWNADGTRVPAPVHSFLLREFFLGNKLKEPNGISLNGVGIDVRRIAAPAYVVAGSTDHIVPWQGAFEMRQTLGGPVRFVLAESGHIAGIINPPASGKRSYWTNDDPTAEPKKWLAGAQRHPGSWWPDWIPWLEQHSGRRVAPPAMGSTSYPALADAPGTYVLEK